MEILAFYCASNDIPKTNVYSFQEISEDIVLAGKKHAIVIEQDGILAETPVTGLKDANSDPQMPVPDE